MRIFAENALVQGQWVQNVCVTTENGIVTAIEPGHGGDLSVAYLAPGLFDKHQHGGGGFDCGAPTMEGCVEWLTLLARHGVTNVLYTLSSSPAEETRNAIAFAAQIMELQRKGQVPGARVMGVHMEGPFLNPVRKGAMNESCIVPPTQEAFRAMTGDHGDIVRAITMAPEIPGALSLAQELSAQGIHVQAGHTDADEAWMARAESAGFSGITHTFNAITPISHRAPGPVVYGILSEGICLEAICDFVHLAPSTVKLLYRAKGADGIAMISDSVTTAGLPDGEYFGGNHYVRVENGRNFTRSGGIAGGYSQLDTGVHNVTEAGIPFAQALSSASFVPARVLGLSHCCGVLAVGREACLSGWSSAHTCLWGFVGDTLYENA